MRLSDHEVEVIVGAVRSCFGRAARVYLFGSRLFDDVRGGDIDLLVDLPEPDGQMVQHRCQAIADMQMALGDQKIDLLVRHPRVSDQALFHEVLEHGIPLC